MERPRIALLNAAHDDDHTRRNFRRELDATLVEFRATERELPAGFAFDGFVVTGSRASVYWDEPWIADLKSWTREAIDRGLAGLGVCFGHQLLADVLGGKVEAMADYEIGYREVRRQSSPVRRRRCGFHRLHDPLRPRRRTPGGGETPRGERPRDPRVQTGTDLRGAVPSGVRPRDRTDRHSREGRTGREAKAAGPRRDHRGELPWGL